jgi:hypothetical protein
MRSIECQRYCPRLRLLQSIAPKYGMNSGALELSPPGALATAHNVVALAVSSRHVPALALLRRPPTLPAMVACWGNADIGQRSPDSRHLWVATQTTCN